MALPKEAHDLVREHIALHEGLPCQGAAKVALLEGLSQLLPNKTPKQVKATLKTLLSTHRPIIQPQCTPSDFKRRAVGDHGSLHTYECCCLLSWGNVLWYRSSRVHWHGPCH